MMSVRSYRIITSTWTAFSSANRTLVWATAVWVVWQHAIWTQWQHRKSLQPVTRSAMSTVSSSRFWKTAGRPKNRTTGCRAAAYGWTRSRTKPLKSTSRATYRNTGRIPITIFPMSTTTPLSRSRMTCTFPVTAVPAFLPCVCGRHRHPALT